MFKLLLLLSIANAQAAEPRFHFKDCVTINQGFYKGCKGIVRDIGPSETSYEVDVECKGDRFLQYLKEDYLDKCPKPKPKKGKPYHISNNEEE